MTRFLDLRALALHELDAAAWQEYYPDMVAFLTDADPATRASAVERLTTAVFWAEDNAERQARKTGDGWELDQETRFAWLRNEIETAHARFDDIIPAFIKGLRYADKQDDAVRLWRKPHARRRHTGRALASHRDWWRKARRQVDAVCAHDPASRRG